MKPSDIIKAYRKLSPDETDAELKTFFEFKPIKRNESDRVEDKNLKCRTEVTDALLNDYSLADRRLIRVLFRAEIECERAIYRHDNLYQLSFYLYSLGQMEDSFLLYEAKYDIGHMDACTMQDRTSITVGHEPIEVIKYVEKRFEEDPKLKTVYAGLIKELQGIIDCPDYESIEEYSRFVRGYFFGHDSPRRAWWKFW
jgi:hypothetical protein